MLSPGEVEIDIQLLHEQGIERRDNALKVWENR